MNNMEQNTSEQIISTIICDTLLKYISCWIKSDKGAIAAFIVPIVAIILVSIINLML